MSLRAEQYRALKRTRELLSRLMIPGEPGVSPHIRKQARDCAKHFPLLDDHGKPMFSKDGFGPDEPPAEPPDSHWDEDPELPVCDWQLEVANDDTRLGYWAWVIACRASDMRGD